MAEATINNHKCVIWRAIRCLQHRKNVQDVVKGKGVRIVPFTGPLKPLNSTSLCRWHTYMNMIDSTMSAIQEAYDAVLNRQASMENITKMSSLLEL